MAPAFLFPFTTCEKPSKDHIIAQPVSASVNFITLIILLVATFLAKTTPLKITFLSYVAFEAWHTFSHIRHIPGQMQTNVVHVLGYMIAFSTLYVILTFSDARISSLLFISIVATILVDIYVWLRVKGVWTVFSGLAIFLVIVLANLHLFPASLRTWIPVMVVFLFILMALFWNESCNCDKMMNYRQLPYHALVEVVGLILFSMLVYVFLQWESEMRNSSSI